MLQPPVSDLAPWRPRSLDHANGLCVERKRRRGRCQRRSALCRYANHCVRSGYGNGKGDVQMNIDWSKAPEGATHWQPENARLMAAWIKMSQGCYWFRMSYMDNWVRYDGPVVHLGDLVPRPTDSAQKALAEQREQTRQAIIDLAAKQCGISGDSIRQLATVLAAEGYRKFEIVEEDV